MENKINLRKWKKVIAIFFVLLFFISNISSVFAAQGTGSWKGYQYSTFLKTTDTLEYGLTSRSLINTQTGESYTVFCAELGVDFSNGIAYNGSYYTPTSETMKKACKVAYLGWYSKYGNYVVDEHFRDDGMEQYRLDYAFTQQYIWEVLGSNATFVDTNIQNQYVNFKTDINNKINLLSQRPSFDSKTIDIDAGETKVITDTYGVLKNYSSIDITENGIRFLHTKGENTITITVPEDYENNTFAISDKLTKSWGLIKEETKDCDTTIFFDLDGGGQDQLIALNYNDPTSLAMKLKINSVGNLELKKLNTDGDLIDGAVFTVTGNDYNKDVEVKNGKIILENIKKGTYTIKEKTAPKGYLLDNQTYIVEVTVNGTSTQAIVNKEPTGNFELVKKNADKSANLSGAEYRIWNDGYDKTFTTDENGKIAVTGLKLGKYNYQEIKAPEGYLIDNKVYSFELVYKDQTTPVVYASAERTNTEPYVEITINKEDTELKNAIRVDGTIHHGDVNIAGAVYTLYADEDIYNAAKTKKYFSKNEEIATFTFDEKGNATIKIVSNNTNLKVNGNTLTGIALGKYYAKETTAPKGYILDTEKHNYDLTYKNSATKVISINDTMQNTVQKAKFKIIKISGKTNSTTKVVEGAEFIAILTKYVDYYGSFDEALKHLDEYAKDEYSVFKTDKNGYGISNLLAYGEYTVNETVTPSPELNTVEEFYVTIDKNSDGVIKELVQNDTPFESYLKIIKVDEESGKKITFSNATFSLYKLNKETNEWEQVSCKIGKENIDSWTTDENAIAYTETKLEGGTYKIEEIKTPKGFVKLEDDCIFEINNINETLEYDEDFDAYITVTVGNKQVTANIIVNKTIELAEKIDTSLLDLSDLSGIKFKLIAKEDILDMADGSVIYKKGTEVGTYNLNSKGELKIENLPLGAYEIQEIETLKGLALDNTKHEIVLKQKDTTTLVYDHTINITNKTITVEFSKTTITGDGELEGATLQVVDKENKIIDEWVSTKETHKIEGLQAGETYKLIETIAPEGYTKSTEIEFTVKDTYEIQKVTMIDKIVEVTKTDFATGEEIEGAELEIIDEDGNVIDSWVSTKEPHKVRGLEEGKTYTLIETTAPYGYEIAESITFTVTSDKETQKVEMKDTPILKDVKLIKIDEDTKEIIKETFTFGIYEDEECTKLIQKIESNTDDGTITFEDLRYGNYYIKEISAPNNYLLSERIVKVKIDDTGVFVDDIKIEEDNSAYNFEFTNKKIETPKTGDERNTLIYAIIFILSVISLITISVKSIKNRKK